MIERVFWYNVWFVMLEGDVFWGWIENGVLFIEGECIVWVGWVVDVLVYDCV